MRTFAFPLLLVSIVAFSCIPEKGPSENFAQTVGWEVKKNGNVLGDYWYQGEAEISRFELEQNRYQGIHPGEVVLVFVTEDFLTDKQVKNDNYTNPNSIPILKTNIIREFTTGLYDYQIMSSVFTPAEPRKHPHTMKVTTSSQDWCGQSFMQINLNKKNYRMQLRSYFENEGDKNVEVPVTLLEDEILNRIRMNPKQLPTGTFSLLPSTVYLRLAHRPFEAVTANAKLGDYTGNQFAGENLKVYTVEMPDLQRTVQYIFQAGEPYLIEGWTDSYPSAFDKKSRTTIARRTHTVKNAYWKKNHPSDIQMREELGLGK